jgi:hypothetical protein
VTGGGVGSGRGRRKARLGPVAMPAQGRGHRRVGLGPVVAPTRGTGPGEGRHGTETGGGAEVARSETAVMGRPHQVGQCRLKLRPERGGQRRG